MSRAVFETATLADAVAKANRVAPTKGPAFDKAAGIVLAVDPNAVGDQAVVIATDLEVGYRQSMTVLEVSDAVTWRLPASLFHGVMSTLPMHAGSTVRLADNGDGNVYFLSGKTKAKLNQIVGEYPMVDPFDASKLVVAPDLARRLAQVGWAADARGSGVLSGVHLDGEMLIACNRSSLVMVPCIVPVDRPVTAPLVELAALIKNTSEVMIRAADDHLELMPDWHTQATSVIYTEQYPNVRGLMNDNSTGQMIVNADHLLAALERVLVLVKAERYPVTTVVISENAMTLTVDVPGVGKVAAELDVVGGETGEPFQISFSPDVLKMALMGSGRPHATIAYGPTRVSPLWLRDDNDYVSLMMPRAVE